MTSKHDSAVGVSLSQASLDNLRATSASRLASPHLASPRPALPSSALYDEHTRNRCLLIRKLRSLPLCVLQKVLESLTILARFWLELDHLEVIWTAGPIDIADGWGKELAVTYTSNLSTGSTFYTDSNGREFQKRTLNHRATWDLNVTEPVSGNYYPITAGAYVKVRLHKITCLVMSP